MTSQASPAEVVCTDVVMDIEGGRRLLVSIAGSGGLSVTRYLPDDKPETIAREKQLGMQTLADLLRRIAEAIDDVLPRDKDQWFIGKAEDPLPNAQMLVSSLCVTRRGMHEHVRIWSRGGYAGSLILSIGDGKSLADAFGLTEETE